MSSKAHHEREIYRLRNTIQSKMKSLELLLESVDRRTDDATSYNRAVLDCIYNKVEDALVALMDADELVDQLN